MCFLGPRLWLGQLRWFRWVEFLCKYWDRGHAVRLSMARLLACRAIEGRNEMGVDVNSLLKGHLVLGKGAPLCALSGNGC